MPVTLDVPRVVLAIRNGIPYLIRKDEGVELTVIDYGDEWVQAERRTVWTEDRKVGDDL